MENTIIFTELLIRLGVYTAIAGILYLITRFGDMTVLKWDFADVRKSGMTAILCIGVSILLGSLFLFACTLQESAGPSSESEATAVGQPSREIVSLEDIYPVRDSCTAADSALTREMAFVRNCVPEDELWQSDCTDTTTGELTTVTGYPSRLILTLLLILPVIAAVKLLRERWASAGITRHNLISSSIVGLIAGILVGTVLLALKQQHTPLTGSHIGLLGYYTIVGLSEEFVFRGYVQTRLIGWFGRTPGWIAASALMALVHLTQRLAVLGASPVDALAVALLLFPLSLFLGYLMLRTGNVVAPGLAHALAGWASAL
ncbi:MAG: CPBP family intramembrane metalloprotease [candidate division Zixibacteria bacterium]|nr:CPBP family intramembrane metalloprotease [candidate division Zixibacteria bacterium]